MIYILFAIAGFMAIVTAYILNSIKKDNKHKTLYRVIVVAISLIIYIAAAIFIFQQKNY
jgi:predicted PurR-regulated permease PerM